MTKAEMQAQVLSINEEVRGLLSKAEGEKRSLTEDEVSAINALEAKRSGIMSEIQLQNSSDLIKTMGHADSERRSAVAFADAVMESIKSRKDIQVRSEGDNTITYSGAEPTVPVTIGEIIAPLEKGLLLDKLGVKIQTGLKGDWKFPVLPSVTASVEGEKAAITDTEFQIGKVTATPHRCALSVYVTNTALRGGDPELKQIVMSQINAGLVRLLNKWAFQESAIATNVNGLFVSPGTTKTYAHGGNPSYSDIVGLKAAVDSTGVLPDASCAYIMNNKMKAYLETTPKVASTDSRMICENGMINGVPVLVSEYVGDGYIKFGYFSYAMIGQFGNAAITVDPFSKAESNIVRFIINADFDIKAARAAAFGVLGEAAGSGSNAGSNA